MVKVSRFKIKISDIQDVRKLLQNQSTDSTHQEE